MTPAVNPNTGQAATRPDALIVSQSQHTPVRPMDERIPRREVPLGPAGVAASALIVVAKATN
ncbi:hypothetical protein SAMN05216368_10536 [Cryobacterium flavum]|uniref:Uncharacterized protein n=1 Tax=Cryobacterium flavum TaxID=1424659 RepID=A0A5E9FYQ9_9MICO|nr:hypothetical protein SAMN05216368_10536 [Cryobacterium flavum]